MGHLRCNIIYSFSLFFGLSSGLGSLLRMFGFLCFTSAVSNKLYYTGDDPTKHLKIGSLDTGPFNIFVRETQTHEVSTGRPALAAACEPNVALMSVSLGS